MELQYPSIPSFFLVVFSHTIIVFLAAMCMLPVFSNDFPPVIKRRILQVSFLLFLLLWFDCPKFLKWYRKYAYCPTHIAKYAITTTSELNQILLIIIIRPARSDCQHTLQDLTSGDPQFLNCILVPTLKCKLAVTIIWICLTLILSILTFVFVSKRREDPARCRNITLLVSRRC